MASIPAKKTCIVIAGPTAVGKTGIAIRLAQYFNTAIISADSRQCYKELNIGVAKPSNTQLQLVKHYFINSHSVTDEVNAGRFEQYALAAAQEIFCSSNVAVMVGGTGLYIKAFCEGMDAIPSVDAAIRNKVTAGYQQGGLAWLQHEIQKRDPDWYNAGEIQNPQRLMRALEIVLATGESILSFQSAKKKERDFDIIKIGLTLPRKLLYEQVNARTDQMIKEGLVEEVRSLMPFQELNALQTVGYSEIFEYFTGAFDFARAVELIKQNTRHYAKRQSTWFSKDVSFKWFSPLDYNQLIDYFINLV
jgi:tRNA dimethylallyltransferase